MLASSFHSLLWICASTLTFFDVNQDCLFTKGEFNEKNSNQFGTMAVRNRVSDTKFVADDAREFFRAFNNEIKALDGGVKALNKSV